MKSNPHHVGPSWRYLLVEGLVIIGSILLAFAIDAYWEMRKERIEEQEVLGGLQREFEGYHTAIENGITRAEAMLSAFSTILGSIEAKSWISDEWSIDQAIWQSLLPPTSDLRNGVRDALVQSGRLEIIRNRALREKLANWPRYYEEVVDDEIFGRNFVFENLIPYLTQSRYHLSSILSTPRGVWPVATHSIEEDPSEVARILSDPEFRSLIEVRFSYWTHSLGEYEDALVAIEEILEDIGRSME